MALTTDQLVKIYTNANLGKAPDAATGFVLSLYSTQSGNGTLTDAQATAKALDLVDGTTAVAVSAYQFFTGKTPSAAGLAYLVNSDDAATGGNKSDLNDQYYAKFSNENRFINFAVNLGTDATSGAAFKAAYGALTFAQTVQLAYEQIVGTSAAVAAGIDVNAAVAYLSRAENQTYLTNFVKANAPGVDQDLGVKAAVVGTILNAALSSNVGAYAGSVGKLLLDLADDGKAASSDAVDLFTAYPTKAVDTVGKTVVLTTGIDAVTGTAGADTFIGSSDGAATSTSNLGDSIDGGDGVDVVRIISNATTTVIPQLKNVETLEIVDTVLESIDVSGVAGLTNLNLQGGTTIAAGTVTATLASGQTLTLKGVTDGDGANDGANQGGVNIATSAAVKALDVVVSGVGGGDGVNPDLDLDFTGAGLATLNLNVADDSVIGLANTGGALAAVNVSGAGGLTVSSNTASAITTFNAASATGAVSIDLSGSTGANQTITGGSAGDTFTVDLARNITLNAGAGDDIVTLANATAANLSSTASAADSINGGDGTDVLQVTATGAASLAGDTAADRAVITGFERLRVSSDLNGQAFSIAALGVNHLQIGAATTTADATIVGFTSGAIVELRANADSANAVIVGVTGATNAGTPDDLLNIRLNANIGDQATAADAIEFKAGIAGINKVVVTTADRSNLDLATSRNDGYILSLSNDSSMTQLTASGSAELSFTSTATTAALATVDASGLSGDLILDLTTNGLTQGVVVTGGGGANAITGTGFADTLSGGARADTITGGAGADTLTGGGEADAFVFAAANFTATSATTLLGQADSITDFAKASDVLRFNSALGVTTVATAQIGGAAINSEGFATFAADDDTLAEKLIAVAASVAKVGDLGVFTHGSDTYVFIGGNAAAGVGSGDALIKLVGVTGLTDGTITTTDLTIT